MVCNGAADGFLQVFGMLVVIYVVTTPYMWARAFVGVVSVATGSAGLMASFKRSISWAKLVSNVTYNNENNAVY